MLIKQIHTFSRDPVNSAKKFLCRVQAIAEKAINFVLKVNNISSSKKKKRMSTDIGLFSSVHWIESESALSPQEIFSLPDIKLTLGICQSSPETL